MQKILAYTFIYAIIKIGKEEKNDNTKRNRKNGKNERKN